MTRAAVSLCFSTLLIFALAVCNERAPNAPSDTTNKDNGDKPSAVETPKSAASAADKADKNDAAPVDKPVSDVKPAKSAESVAATDKPATDKTVGTEKPAATETPATEKPADTKPATDTKPTDTAKPADTAKPDTDKPADAPKVAAVDKPATTGDSPAANVPHPTPITPHTSAAAADPLDWPNWRGPEQNRISHETGLIDKWNLETKENVLWTRDDVVGRCTPIVMRGKVYTIARYLPGKKREQEQTVCLDAATGELIWRNLHNMFLSDVPAERIGWASPVGDPATGRLYAYGSNGLLQCFDGDTGKVIWSRSLMEQFGVLSVFGGRTNFPAIIGDLLLVSSVQTGWGDRSAPAHRFIAFDKNTGEVVWFNKGTTEKPEDTTFSTPYVGQVNGQFQFVEGSSDGAVWGFQPRTGRALWKYQMSRRGLSCSPFVDGDTIYMCQNEENLDNFTTGMVAAFSAKHEAKFADEPITLGKANTIWQLPGKMTNKSTQCTPVLYEGRLYAPDNASNFYVIDAAKGKVLQKVKLTGDETVGSPLVADGKIYLATTAGWHVFKPTPKGVDVVDRMRFEGTGEALGSVIVSHARLYLPTTERLICLGHKDAQPKSESTGAAPEASATAEADKGDATLAQLLVIPGEVLLKPGEKQQFHVRMFNAVGEPIKEIDDVTFELKGPGSIDKSGLYQAAEGAAHTATIVTAKVGGVAGQARIRVVPPLPWKFDFQKIALVENPKTKVPEGIPSQTWIGLNYRHVIREVDGHKVMVKLNNIPKGTRSQGWMGPDDLHDYTVQADIQASTNRPDKPSDGLPDAGLIAQRYTLSLMGADQQLQIRYWPPQVATQFSKTVPFEWKDKVWYTMKFRASTEGDKVNLQGKVWPRDEKEPDAWSIEVTDDMPNLEGSPGLSGDTSNKGEFSYDNIQVYPNK